MDIITRMTPATHHRMLKDMSHLNLTESRHWMDRLVQIQIQTQIQTLQLQEPMVSQI